MVTQLNIHVTPAFERALKRFMRLRGLSSKSEAVRIAVQDAAEREAGLRSAVDFTRLRGAGLDVAVNPHPRFSTEDELWE